MITIKEMHTKKELTQFVKFPFSLYKDNPYWVPPIIKDEVATFDKSQNPVFKEADAHFFVAIQNNKIVGRVCAIVNWTEVNKQHIKKCVLVGLILLMTYKFLSAARPCRRNWETTSIRVYGRSDRV